MGVTRLHLLRHAAAEPERCELEDPGLSPAGHVQARRLGGRLTAVPADTVWHSPLRRARETAQVIAGMQPGWSARPAEHLRDRTPVPSKASLAQYPAHLRDWFAQVPEDERDVDGSAISAAITAAVEASTPDGPDVDLLWVTHAFVVGWFVQQAVDAPAWRWMGLVPDNASLTTIRYSSDGPVLLGYNDVGHLRCRNVDGCTERADQGGATATIVDDIEAGGDGR